MHMLLFADCLKSKCVIFLSKEYYVHPIQVFQIKKYSVDKRNDKGINT